MRRRLWIILAAGIAGWVYLQGADVARAADGSDGATLLFAASPAEAIGWFVLLSVAVSLLAAVAAAVAGSPLGGAFAIAFALAFPAVAGGTIDPWLRGIDSSAAYWVLLVEALVWAVLLVAAIAGCHVLGRRLRQGLLGRSAGAGLSAAAAGTDRPGGDAEAEPIWFADFATEPIADAAARAERAGPAGGAHGPAGRSATAENPRPLEPGPQRVTHSLAGGAVAVAAGGGLVAILLQSSDTWQVFWGLLLAFAIAGALAHQLFPGLHPLAILLSPLAAAVAWYAWAAVAGGPAEAMLRAYFAGRFIPGAMALPIHYASAGVAGAALGLAWSRALLAHEDHDEPDDDSR